MPRSSTAPRSTRWHAALAGPSVRVARRPGRQRLGTMHCSQLPEGAVRAAHGARVDHRRVRGGPGGPRAVRRDDDTERPPDRRVRPRRRGDRELRARVRAPARGRRGDGAAVRQPGRPADRHGAHALPRPAGRAHRPRLRRAAAAAARGGRARRAERAVAHDLPGVFNVAADGVLLLSQAIRRAGRCRCPCRSPEGNRRAVLAAARVGRLPTHRSTSDAWWTPRCCASRHSDSPTLDQSRPSTTSRAVARSPPLLGASAFDAGPGAGRPRGCTTRRRVVGGARRSEVARDGRRSETRTATSRRPRHPPASDPLHPEPSGEGASRAACVSRLPARPPDVRAPRPCRCLPRRTSRGPAPGPTPDPVPDLNPPPATPPRAGSAPDREAALAPALAPARGA